MNNINKAKLKATYEFENGRARMVNRGVYFWNGSEDSISASNPMRSADLLFYELLGEPDVWSGGHDLKGIKITIEIEEATKQ